MSDVYKVQAPIRDVAALEALLTPMHPSQVNKFIDRIDAHIAAWIERTTFVAICSSDRTGRQDVSPKGDPAGFIKVLDYKTLVIPDRIGNRRMDTFRNVLENPNVGLMLVIPKRKEVVRINGRAEIARDDALRDMTTLNGHRPDLALVVRVEEAFFHCGKAMIRSAMWQPDKWGSIEGLPSYAQALKDHGEMEEPLARLEEDMATNERERLY
ncbi:MAG: MSMEG_1061 family FMN-dependent PPOX-type flavoprotein [Pseudomonadota bacterium]